MSKKLKGLIFVLLALLVAVSVAQVGFALDNQTEISADANDGMAHYYFDSNVENDTGNGSIDNPYKQLTDARIKDNSVIHLANGEYYFTPVKSKANIYIFGQDSQQTIIRGSGKELTVSQNLFLSNITLVNTQIYNQGKLNASNVIFKDAGAKTLSYGNSYGGAIYSSAKSYNVYLDNCLFENNHAEYGGAIYISGGVLEISNSVFSNNTAYNFGGAIAAIYSGSDRPKIKIRNSTFIGDVSLNDAGGAIYVRGYNLTANCSAFCNSKATFGAAVCVLNSDSYLYSLDFYNNTAKYNGGAIYQIYGTSEIMGSNFESNHAKNGGAAYLDACFFAKLDYNSFAYNSADICAGAVYLILNEESYADNNTYLGNSAFEYDDIFNSTHLDVFISDSNYTLYKYSPAFNGTFPSYYNLADLGYVGPVKDQMSGGNCWAFASLAALESALLKAGGENIVLSEENMKNIMAFFSDYGWSMETNEGGYDGMSQGYLVGWLGPVYQSEDLYDDNSHLSALLDSIVHVQNIVYLKRDNFTDNDAIKKAIMDYGAVYTPIKMSAYSSGGTYVQYYNKGTSCDHAVLLVGWDDDFTISGAPGKGAWIVKNSWGSSWGNKGYFYVSYYDTSCAKVGALDAAWAFVFNDSMKYDKNYQYDIPGKTDFFLNSSDTVWYKNKFTSTGNEYLAAVSTYFEKNTNWTISVYVNDTLKLVQEGFSNPGYLTIELNELIPIRMGDVFEVVFRIATEGRAAFPISEIFSLNTLIYGENISYVSYDGENWQDLFELEWQYPDHTYASQVACIKAFTVLDEIKTQTFINMTSIDNYANISVRVLNQYGNPVRGGKVIFNISGDILEREVSNGFAMLSYDFDFGSYNISAEYVAAGYVPSGNSISITVSKVNVRIYVNVTTYRDTALINITLSKPLNNEIVINNLTLKLVNGTCAYNMTGLDYGSHHIDVHLLSDKYDSNDVSADFTISYLRTAIFANDLVTVYRSGDMMVVRLLDQFGNPVEGANINYAIGRNGNSSRTDREGQIYIPSSVDVGVYDVDISFAGDDGYGSSSAVANLTVNKASVVMEDVISVSRDASLINVSVSKVISGSVVLTVDGVEHVVNLSDGEASLALSGLGYGMHDVKVCLVSSSYEAQNITDTFMIDYVKTRIVADNLTTYYESGDRIVVRLVDELNRSVSEAKVSYQIGSDANVGYTDLEGQIYIPSSVDVGVYDVDISFAGDDGHAASSAAVKLTVNKASLVMDDEISVQGNSAQINVSVSKAISGSVVLTVDDAEYVVNLSEGKASLALSGFDYGLHDVKASLVSSSYEAQDITDTFMIDYVKTRIVADNLTTYYESGDRMVVRLVDELNRSVSEAKISYKIGSDSDVAYTDSQGQIYIPSSVDVGVYDIGISFAGDDGHAASSAAIRMTVNKASVEINDMIFIIQDGASIDIGISKAIGGNVVVTVDGNIHTLELSEGTASLTLSDLDVGLHNVTVRLVSSSYEADDVLDTFMITYVRTVIVAYDMTTDYGSEDKLPVRLIDRYGNPVSGENLFYTINGNTNKATTDANGTIGVDLDLAVGSYDVCIEFMGSRNYINSSGNVNVVIKTTIILPDATTYAQNAVYKVKSNDSITLVINDVVYSTKSLTVTLKPGTYEVKVINDRSGEIKTQKIKVVSRITQNKDITMYYGADTSYKVKVFDDNGNPAGGVKVSFTLNGKTYSRTTNSNGIASLKITLQPKTYKITATYKKVKVSNRITVKPTLIMSNKVVKKSKTFKYSVKLLNNKGKILKNKKVVVKFREKTYKAKTNAKGIAIFKIKSLSKVGKFKLTASYGSAKISKVVTVKR